MSDPGHTCRCEVCGLTFADEFDRLKRKLTNARDALATLAQPFFRGEGATVYDENTRLRAELVILREAQHERLIAAYDRAEKAERELAETLKDEQHHRAALDLAEVKVSELQKELVALRGAPDTGDDALCNVRRIRSELAATREELDRLSGTWPLMAASNLLYFESRRLLNEGKDREPLLAHVRALNAALDAVKDKSP